MHFKTIGELYEYQGLPAPENPLLGLIQFNSLDGVFKNTEITHDFYVICCKKLESGEFWYGKTKYDSDKGFMYFLKPMQKLAIHDVIIKENGFSIYIHEDYLMGHPLYADIKKYRSRKPHIRACLNFLSEYFDEETTKFFELDRYTVKFLQYDWQLNEQPRK